MHFSHCTDSVLLVDELLMLYLLCEISNVLSYIRSWTYFTELWFLPTVKSRVSFQPSWLWECIWTYFTFERFLSFVNSIMVQHRSCVGKWSGTYFILKRFFPIANSRVSLHTFEAEHTSHNYGFSPLWSLEWLFKLPYSEIVAEHNWYLKGFFPLLILERFWNDPACANETFEAEHT